MGWKLELSSRHTYEAAGRCAVAEPHRVRRLRAALYVIILTAMHRNVKFKAS